MQTTSLAGYEAQHFLWQCEGSVATITLNRPERKNPLTFDSYAELRDLFRNLVYAADVDVVVITGAGGNFCSGGDVHDIIGPLTEMNMKDLIGFHAHDGRPRQSHAGLSATGDQCRRGYLRWRRRHHRDGQRSALRE